MEENSLASVSPQASICLSPPFLNTSVIPLSPPSLSLLSIDFPNNPSSPAVDLYPPPPNSTRLFSFGVIFIPPMFIHDRGSERKRARDKKPSAELAPRAARAPSHATHMHTQHTPVTAILEYMRMFAYAFKRYPSHNTHAGFISLSRTNGGVLSMKLLLSLSNCDCLPSPENLGFFRCLPKHA